MQTLIPLIVYLGLATGTHLTLVPYAYLVDPLPVYHQSQNTRTGEHAYSYSGGPSAKEEVKGLDGVTRGSYSYIDANGILQSVFYVADEAGFRVAATNLPSSNDLPSETAEVRLARMTHREAHEKASRKKRSLEDPTPNQENIETKSSEKNKEDNKVDQAQSESSIVPLSTVLLPKFGISHQSRVDIHRNLKLEPVEPVEPVEPLEPAKLLKIPATPIYARIAIDRYQSGVPIVETVEPHYQDARVQFHQSLGIEGPNPKDAVKIEHEPVTIVEPVISGIQSSPILTKEVVAIPSAVPAIPSVSSIITAYSSQSRSQIHQNSKLKLDTAIPESVYVEAAPVSYVHPISTVPALIAGSVPIAQSSQYQSQIRLNQKFEPITVAIQNDA